MIVDTARGTTVSPHRKDADHAQIVPKVFRDDVVAVARKAEGHSAPQQGVMLSVTCIITSADLVLVSPQNR